MDNNNSIFAVHKLLDAFVTAFKGTPRTYYKLDIQVIPDEEFAIMHCEINDELEVIRVYFT